MFNSSENGAVNHSLNGTWEVNYIMGTEKPFDQLYSIVKPTLVFNTSTENRVSGITGCNNFTGTFSLDGNKIRFNENMAVTRKMCPDMAGENAFLETLKKINTFSISNDGTTLNMIMGDIAVLRAIRK